MNDMFLTRPPLPLFVTVIEKESRRIVEKLNNIRLGREQKCVHKELTIPEIPDAYILFEPT